MMKQNQLNHSSSSDMEGDAFDNFLAKQLQENQHYLPDIDFTAQVMKSLPAPKKLSVWQERLIILVPVLVISLLVLSQFSIVAVIVKLWIFLVGMSITQLVQIGSLISLVIISGASVWFARQLKLI
jgi:hypothetical protein